jgi:hypothetical protein
VKLVRSFALWALLFAALAPSGAGAASFNAFSSDGLGPSGGAGNEGPANIYPSSIEVEGLPGNLSKVTSTMLRVGSGKPDDIDMLLVGPEGDEVMLMSDACGTTRFTEDVIAFDDDAAAPPPDSGPCGSQRVLSFQPSNYVGAAPEPDQFGVGAVAPPYATTLSTFIGTDPNGTWDLYVLDDDEEILGFDILGWELSLSVDSPLAPPTTIVQTVTVPGPPVPTPSAGAKTSAKTGKRAAALAKCAKKKTPEKRTKCRAQARKLPV